jgi:hypothetical protein
MSEFGHRRVVDRSVLSRWIRRPASVARSSASTPAHQLGVDPAHLARGKRDVAETPS